MPVDYILLENTARLLLCTDPRTIQRRNKKLKYGCSMIENANIRPSSSCKEEPRGTILAFLTTMQALNQNVQNDRFQQPLCTIAEELEDRGCDISALTRGIIPSPLGADKAEAHPRHAVESSSTRAQGKSKIVREWVDRS
eukprot:Rmarinus@m.13667